MDELFSHSGVDRDSVSEEQPEWANTRVDSRVGFMGREDSISGPSGRSRVRSIECMSIDVSIVGYDIISSSETSTTHVVYFIEVAPGLAKRWNVKRRYNDFVYLDNQLKKSSGQIKVRIHGIGLHLSILATDTPGANFMTVLY